MNLSEELLAQLQGAPVQQMAQQLGAGTEQVQSALGQVLPVLLGALGHNAAQPQGVADLLGGWLGAGAGIKDGAKILGQKY